MRAYTIYKDENGKLFAVFDDMIDKYAPMTGTGDLTEISKGYTDGVKGIVDVLKRIDRSENNS